MLKKKFIFLVFVSLFFVILGCEKRVSLTFPEPALDYKEAYDIVTKTLNKQIYQEGFVFKKMLAAYDSKHVAFVWEIENKKEVYIRYWSYDGTNLRVQLQVTENGLKYFVTLRNNGEDYGDCYGFSNTMPVPRPKRFDIYWNTSTMNGCRQMIRYEFENKQEAVLFAQALQYLFVDHKIYDILYELENPQSELTKSVSDYNEVKTTNTNESNVKQEDVQPEKPKEEVVPEKKEEPKAPKETKSTESTSNVVAPSSSGKKFCTVDKILKMKEIGLTDSEIKTICK
jgi:hypothetical protein